jgi:hypothetical protein
MGRRSAPIDTPQGDLGSLCSSARQVSELCDLLGFEFRGSKHLIALLEGAQREGVPLTAMIEDPANRPYFWDLES